MFLQLLSKSEEQLDGGGGRGNTRVVRMLTA